MISLADAIISEDINQVHHVLELGADVNELDEYGFTPLIEAAIADNVEIARLLIRNGANVYLPDMTGGTALHWAAENNNLDLCQLLLERRADPNAYTLAGQPVLVMPVLRQQTILKNLLIDHGADLVFAQDYINTKMLGHMYELVGTANIIDPKNRYVEIDFEGFYLEVSLGMIADSLTQFTQHFAARQLRHYGNVSLGQVMVDVLNRAAQLIKYQQYRVKLEKYVHQVEQLIEQEPVIIPVGYEGHAITFVKLGGFLIKCDRREDSRLYDNIVIYQVGNLSRLTTEFIKKMIFEKQNSEFINNVLPEFLALEPVTEIKIGAQISGNCSWANVEACIPVLYFLLSSYNPDYEDNIPRYKSLALKYFRQWREWNKDRSLNYCIQSMNEMDSIRRACKAEILAAILFQSCNIGEEVENRERIERILPILMMPEYEYLLKNYIKSYCFEDQSEEGQNFLRLLKQYGYQVGKVR